MRLAALALLLAACGDDACKHGLFEFCNKSSADCRPYDARVAALRALPQCPNPTVGVRVALRACGSTRLIDENDGFGGAIYAYDAIGKLAGVTAVSDTPFACGAKQEEYGDATTCASAVDEKLCVCGDCQCACPAGL